MKEFSSIISVYPISELTDLNPAPWMNDMWGLHFFYADTFQFNPLPTEQDAGTLYDCDQTFIIDTPSQLDLLLFSTSQKCILVLSDTEGTKYPIGTKTIPGRVYIQRGIQKSRLIFTCKSLTNPI